MQRNWATPEGIGLDANAADYWYGKYMDAKEELAEARLRWISELYKFVEGLG